MEVQRVLRASCLQVHTMFSMVAPVLCSVLDWEPHGTPSCTPSHYHAAGV